MNRFVLDCSMYMSWYLDDEKSDISSKVFCSVENHKIIVPVLWNYEVASALAVSVKRKRLKVMEVNRIISDISLLPITYDKNMFNHIQNLFQLATEHSVSAYDAAYIELALRLNLPMASLDKDLIRISQKLGVPRFKG